MVPLAVSPLSVRLKRNAIPSSQTLSNYWNNTMPGKQTVILTDFGTYLKTLRKEKNISQKELAKGLNLSELTVRNVENGTNYPPQEARLKLWLSLLGQSARYNEAVSLLRCYLRQRTVQFQPRHEANQHLSRLLDAYDAGKLDALDLQLLRMIAPREL